VELLEEFLNLLLPSKCVLCAKAGSCLCEECVAGLNLVPRKVSRIGLAGFASCEYGAETAKLISEFKESNQTSIAKTFANSMVLALKEFDLENAVLIPMPSKRETFSKRGFEPAALIARAISKKFAKDINLLLPVKNLLSYRRQVSDQAALSGEARRKNLVGNMVVEKRRESSAFRAILIDDVVTTGATLTEAKRALGEIGVEVLGFVTFAETLPKNRQKHPAKTV
jgi:ComF family protein